MEAKPHPHIRVGGLGVCAPAASLAACTVYQPAAYQPAYQPVYQAPPPAYYAPPAYAYAPAPYYAPAYVGPSIGLGFAFSSGGHGGHHHGHWYARGGAGPARAAR